MKDYDYRCCNCGREFDEEEARTRYENVGEFWGQPAYMETMVCPSCGSDEIEEIEEEEEDDDRDNE